MLDRGGRGGATLTSGCARVRQLHYSAGGWGHIREPHLLRVSRGHHRLRQPVAATLLPCAVRALHEEALSDWQAGPEVYAAPAPWSLGAFHT